MSYPLKRHKAISLLSHQEQRCSLCYLPLPVIDEELCVGLSNPPKTLSYILQSNYSQI